MVNSPRQSLGQYHGSTLIPSQAWNPNLKTPLQYNEKCPIHSSNITATFDNNGSIIAASVIFSCPLILCMHGLSCRDLIWQLTWENQILMVEGMLCLMWNSNLHCVLRFYPTLVLKTGHFLAKCSIHLFCVIPPASCGIIVQIDNLDNHFKLIRTVLISEKCAKF